MMDPMAYRYFYDCEFIEDGRTIDLVSIGVVDEHGREFYAISTEFDDPGRRAVGAAQRAGPAAVAGRPGLAVPRPHPRRAVRVPGRAAARGARAELELWAWYAAYDHVALAQLWGPMPALPREIPRFTKDLRQLWDDRGRPALPERRGAAPRRAGRRPAQPGPVAGARRPVELVVRTSAVERAFRLARRRCVVDSRVPARDRYSAHVGPPRAGNGAVEDPGHSPKDPATPPPGSGQRPAAPEQARAQLGWTSTHANRCADRRRRLPRPERGDPGRRPQGRRDLRPRVRRLPRRLARPARGPDHAARASTEVRGILPRGGTILGSSRTNPFKIDGGVERIKTNLAELGRGRADRDRRRGHPRRRDQAERPRRATWSACRRRSTTTSTRPTTPSASTPRSTSRWRRSTGCTPPPSRTTARWSSR